MARNRSHYIRGKKITASKGSYWGPKEIAAHVQSLKAHDPSMVVALYPVDFRDALRDALEAAGMRWRYLEPGELELIRAQRRAELKRIEAEQREEWRRSRSAA